MEYVAPTITLKADQGRIVCWLRSVNAPGVAEAYISALEVEARLPFPGAGSLLAHCLREILNRIGDAFGSEAGEVQYEKLAQAIIQEWPAEVPESALNEPDGPQLTLSPQARKAIEELIVRHREGVERNKGKFRSVLVGMLGRDVPRDQIEPVVKAVASIKGPAPGEAHFVCTTEKRTDPERWRSELRAVEHAFLALATSFFDHLDRIDQILRAANESDAPPTTDQIHIACLAIARLEHQSYFFDRLSKPAWIRPLADLGWFTNPPASTMNDGPFRAWPQSGYLLRMCSLPGTAVDLAFAITKIKDNGNPIVRGDIVRMLLHLPPTTATPFVRKLVSWTGEAGAWTYANDLRPLTLRLAAGGAAGEALKVASVFLALKAPKGKALFPEVTIRCRADSWSYVQFLDDDLPPIAQSLGVPYVELLCDLVNTSLKVSSDKDDPYSDGSRVWRRTLDERHDQTDIRGSLVTAIVQAASALLTGNPERGDGVLAALARRPRLIFDRIALRLLREHPLIPVPDAILDNRRLFFEFFTVEYQDFVRSRVPSLSVEKVAQLRAWLDEGVNVEVWRQNHLAFFGRPLEPERETIGVKEWRVERLWMLEGARTFDEGLKQELSTLIDEGFSPEVEVPGRPVIGGGFGDPAGADDVRPWRMDDIVLALNSFGREAPPGEVELTALRTLSMTAVSRDPATFATALASTEAQLPFPNVSVVFQGLWQALVDGKPFVWAGVLRQAARLIAAVPDPEDEETLPVLKRTTASLLHHALQKNVAFAQDEWNEVRRILIHLTADSDPTPERDAAESGRDAYTYSINTVRGTAVVALMELVDVMARRAGAAWRGLDDATDVREALEARIDGDPSPGVRAALGARFPLLVTHDATWAETVAPKVFSGTGLTFAMDGFLRAWEPSEQIFIPLRLAYEATVNAWDRVETDPGDENELSRRLGWHLFWLYVRGVDGADELLRSFFAKASLALRHVCLTEVGNALGPAKVPLSEVMTDRLVRLWDARVAAVRDSAVDQRQELLAFWTWAGSGHFDPTWMLSRLEEASRLTAAGRFAYVGSRVLKRMAELVEQQPQSVISCLRTLVEFDPECHLLFGTIEPVTTILKASLETNGPAHETAKEIINEFGRRGRLEFRGLLRPPGGATE